MATVGVIKGTEPNQQLSLTLAQREMAPISV